MHEEEPPILRTLERGSLILVLALLAGLAAWFGTRDSRLGRAVREQGDQIERTGERVELHERAIADQAVTIESNRVEIERHSVELERNAGEIEDLRAAGVAHERALEELRARGTSIEERLTLAEGDLEKTRALEEALLALREQLRAIESASANDARRIAELSERLAILDRERRDELDRIERIERSLGIEPDPR